jgi:hypothetical protein
MKILRKPLFPLLMGSLIAASSNVTVAQSSCAKPAGQQAAAQQTTPATQQVVQFYSYPMYSTPMYTAPVYTTRMTSRPMYVMQQGVVQQGYTTINTQQGTMVVANQQGFPLFPLVLGGLSLADALVGGDKDKVVIAAIGAELAKLRDNLAAGSAPAGTAEKIAAIESFLASKYPDFKPGVAPKSTSIPGAGGGGGGTLSDPTSTLIPGAQQSTTETGDLTAEVKNLSSEVHDLTAAINNLAERIGKTGDAKGEKTK